MATKRDDEGVTEFIMRQIQIVAWNEAIDAALEVVPGGDVADPQDIVDYIRALKRED